jgi:hypothetical protein
MRLYNTLKLFYELKDSIKLSSIEITDVNENIFYLTAKSFENLFATNLESIDNVMTFELLASDVRDVNPILEQEKLIIHIKGYKFYD